ncbi:XRE family transcriptional regulator [Kribbella sp. NPDC056951]|uniref:XRE family transcriptional regulator n=1 Tax=Kribbella sp. NPDC056951 TaxID=3345978 RepID=UPI00362664F1
MPHVDQWTGRESRLLRESLRQSVRAFADGLGVAPRTVANWEAGGSAVRPRPDMQAILDTALRRATAEVQERFATRLMAAGVCAGDEPVEIRSAGKGTEDLNRRELLRLLSLAGAVLA